MNHFCTPVFDLGIRLQHRFVTASCGTMRRSVKQIPCHLNTYRRVTASVNSEKELDDLCWTCALLWARPPVAWVHSIAIESVSLTPNGSE